VEEGGKNRGILGGVVKRAPCKGRVRQNKVGGEEQWRPLPCGTMHEVV